MLKLTKNSDLRGHPFALYRHGDCVEGSRQFLPEGCVDLLITDPPYGIRGDSLHKHYNRKEEFVIEGYTEISGENYEAFSFGWIAEAERVLRKGGSAYIVSGWTHLRHILNALERTRLKLVNHIVWKYNFGVFTQNKFVTSHYHILYLSKPGGPVTFNTYARFSPREKTDSNRSVLYADMEDVWTLDREYKAGQIRNKNELPTQLLAKMIQYSSHEGDVVADFFAGSFSTAKVAKSLNRSSLSFEISRKACSYQVPKVRQVEWGSGLQNVPHGLDDRPLNQNKPWDPGDVDRLVKSYGLHRKAGLSKKGAIEKVQVEFERGYFSILNALKRQGL